MKCAECGSDLPNDSVYCLVCGGKVGDEQNNVFSYANLPFGTVLVCPKCGEKNSRTDRWCRYCDTDLEYAKKQLASPTSMGPDCRVCGISSPEGSQYCRKCGASLSTGRTREPSGVTVSLPFLTPGDSEPAHQHEIIRERQVIMIRCKYCGTLNGPSAQKCSSCGAQM